MPPADGKTYPNACEAWCAGLLTWTMGACGGGGWPNGGSGLGGGFGAAETVDTSPRSWGLDRVDQVGERRIAGTRCLTSLAVAADHCSRRDRTGPGRFSGLLCWRGWVRPGYVHAVYEYTAACRTCPFLPGVPAPGRRLPPRPPGRHGLTRWVNQPHPAACALCPVL